MVVGFLRGPFSKLKYVHLFSQISVRFIPLNSSSLLERYRTRSMQLPAVLVELLL